MLESRSVQCRLNYTQQYASFGTYGIYEQGSMENNEKLVSPKAFFFPTNTSCLKIRGGNHL